MTNTGPHVLIVNHDPVTLALMAEKLEERGCRVQAVSSRAEALQAIRTQRPDVILASATLNDVGGLQLCRLLRPPVHQNGSPPLPVILTGIGQADLIAEEYMRAADAFAYVHPTEDFDRLYEVVQAAVGQISAANVSPRPYLARALLISRDPAGTAELQATLRSAGWDIHTSEGPADAREALEKHEFDIVLFDGDTANGWTGEFLKNLKALAPETVVIGLTSDCSEDAVVALMQLGADDYLLKPAVAESVNIVCFNALNRHSFLRIHRRFQEKFEELRDMSDYLDTVIRHSQEAIFSCDLVGRVRIWNKGAERMYGYTAEEICGGIVDDFLDPPEFTRKSPDVVRIVQQRGGSFVEPEIMRRKKNGEIFVVHATYSAIMDADGECIGFSVIERDVGTHKALEAEKIKSARLRAITQTAVTANDQINTPLGVILGYAQFLQRKMNNIAPEDAAALEIIQQQVLKIKGIMNKLKLMSDPIVKNYSIEGVTMLDLSQSK